MRTLLLNISLGLFLCSLLGCSVELIRTSDSAKELEYARRLNPNEGPVKITKSKGEPNTIIINWGWNTGGIELSKPCRVKYQTFYFDFIDLIVVPGTLPNGKTYSIWLDTGYRGYALTNSLTIIENDLAIYPLGKESWTSTREGICHLPSLQIGQVTIKNPPCEYLQLQWEVRLIGLPIWQQKGVLIGLNLLKGFGHIVFDNTKKEVEFAPSIPFEPDDPKRWDSYSFKIEKRLLMVDIPVEDQNSHLMFDTCGRYGMVVTSDTWEKLPMRLKTVKVKERKFFSGFLGELSCYKTKIKNLKIGNQVVKNAEIIILPEDSPYLSTVNSISMKYFKKTVVVLDFKRNLMWVKHRGID